MELQLFRYRTEESTAGFLLVDGVYFCHTGEPPNKIPTGRYRIQLREVDTPMNRRYGQKFPTLHRGMIWLQDVPQREWIYIHLGNDPKRDSEGCILVAESSTTKNGDVYIGNSTPIYEKLYGLVVEALEANEEVWITVTEVAV